MAIQYQGVWSLQSAAQLQSTQQWVTDPLFENTTLLLQADDAANGANNNTFLDASPNGVAITRVGNVAQGTFTPFSSQSGAWSNYFDGSGDRLVLATNTALDLTDDFTIECWIYPTAISTFNIIFDTALNGTAGANMTELFLSSPNTLSYYARGSTLLSGTGITLNSWQHVALTKSGTTQRLFLNGVVIASTTSSTQPNTGYSWYIGDRIAGAPSSQYPFSGNISNFRVVKGVAVYTGNFTPPPLPLTTTQSAGVNIAAVTGTQTSLLTCQGNRFIDISSNTLPIIREGDTAAQPFSPFAPQYQWTSSVIGGSGFFDGNDYLEYPTSINSLIGAIAGKQLTFEFWINTTQIAAVTAWNMGLFGNYAPTAANGRYAISLLGSSASSPQSVSFGWTTSTSTGVSVTATTTLNQKAWNHVAITINATTASSTTIVIYINGVGQTFTGQNFSSHTADPSLAFRLGENRVGDQGFWGHVAGFKISSGIQRSSNFTPPTSPFTSDANTILLLNFTNAAIFDGTMKNNLETVSSAQISTAVTKYGSGSMAFDGDTDFVGFPKNENVNFGSGDFTIEFWTYWNAFGSDKKYCLSVTSAGSYWQFNHDSTNGVGFIIGGVGSIFLQGNNSGWVTGTWYHVALVRRGTTLTVYRDGVALASGTLSGVLTNYDTFCVGGSLGFTTTTMNGYIDDFRVTKGVARYTANFIPPSVALPRQ